MFEKNKNNYLITCAVRSLNPEFIGAPNLSRVKEFLNWSEPVLGRWNIQRAVRLKFQEPLAPKF